MSQLEPQRPSGQGWAPPTADVPAARTQAPPPTASVAPMHVGAPSYAVQGYGIPGSTRLMTDQRPAGGVVAIAWVLAVLTFGYMLPWAVAASRGRANQGAIGLINFFLGWSLIGWIVALVMACQAHQVVAAPAHTTVLVAQQFHPSSSLVPPGWYPAPEGSGRQYWDGERWTQHWTP